MAISANQRLDGSKASDDLLTSEEQREFYTPKEVAAMFGVTPRTVANWCDQGRLACVTTLGGQRRILASSIKGGRDYDAKKAAFVARMAEKRAGKPELTGDQIATELLTREH